MSFMYYRSLLLLIAAVVYFSGSVLAQNLTDVIFYQADTGKKAWYEGQVRDKKPHGMGVSKSKDGMIYIGDFSNGEINGYGMMLAGQGNLIANCKECGVYVGNWKNGKKSGMGTCYAENGDVVYLGRFENDKPVETYPATDDYSFKYFTLNEYADGDAYLGEINDGTYHGFGLYAWADGGIWFGGFREGEQKGIGLFLENDGEWVVFDYKDGDYTEINSSVDKRNKDAHHKTVRAKVRAANRELLTEGLGYIVAGARTAQGIKDVWNPDNEAGFDESDVDAGGNGGGSSSRSASTSSSGSSDCGGAWRTDSRTYSNYESQLIKMRTYPENYSNYTSDYTDIQAKMRQIRQKWEARGCTINKSPHE